MYQSVKITKHEKCGRTIAEPKVFIRLIEGKVEYWREKVLAEPKEYSNTFIKTYSQKEK